MLAAADPQATLRERLNQIEGQLAALKRLHEQKAMRSLAGSPKPWNSA